MATMNVELESTLRIAEINANGPTSDHSRKEEEENYTTAKGTDRIDGGSDLASYQDDVVA